MLPEIEAILKNPTDLAIWVAIVIFLVKQLVAAFGAYSSLSNRSHDTIAQENSLQVRLLDHMAAARLADEQFKQDMVKTTKGIALLLHQERKRLARIDSTTQDTNKHTKRINSTTGSIEKDVRQLKAGLILLHKMVKNKEIVH